MSETYKFIYEPLNGEFLLVKRPTIQVAGGVTVTNGILALPSGAQVECNLEIVVTNSSNLAIEPGSTILVI